MCTLGVHGPGCGLKPLCAHPLCADKLEQNESSLLSGGRSRLLGGLGEKKKGADDALAKIYSDAAKVTAEEIKGLSAQVIKEMLFNCDLLAGHRAAAVGGTAPTPMET